VALGGCRSWNYGLRALQGLLIAAPSAKTPLTQKVRRGFEQKVAKVTKGSGLGLRTTSFGAFLPLHSPGRKSAETPLTEGGNRISQEIAKITKGIWVGTLGNFIRRIPSFAPPGTKISRSSSHTEGENRI
jgi:hypothetical protein